MFINHILDKNYARLNNIKAMKDDDNSKETEIYLLIIKTISKKKLYVLYCKHKNQINILRERLSN